MELVQRGRGIHLGFSLTRWKRWAYQCCGRYDVLEVSCDPVTTRCYETTFPHSFGSFHAGGAQFVMVDGSPLPDGQITFESVEDGLDCGASRIDHKERFSMFLKPGVYRVGIESVEGGVSPAGLGAVEPAKLRVAKRYADPRASGLEYTIDASNRRLTIDIPK